MAKSYLEPLLAFSGNAFADARSKLVQSLSDDELRTLLQDGSKRCTKRKALEQLSKQMLDHIDAEPRATSALPVRNNNIQHLMQPQPAPAHDAYDPAIFGTSSQRFQPKRKASESADSFGVRLRKAAALNPTDDDISKLFNGEEDDDEDWGGMTAKSGHVLQDETPADASADINVIDIRSTTLAIPVLRIGAWYPSVNGCKRWQPLTSLGRNSGAEIHAKFLAHFAIGEAKRAAYSAVVTSVAKGNEPGGGCINVAIRQREHGLPTFKRAKVNEQEACDTCIRAKRLCVRALKDPEIGAKLCVLPLPAIYFQGKAVDSIDEWVIGG